jgi:hypothetical protein
MTRPQLPPEEPVTTLNVVLGWAEALKRKGTDRPLRMREQEQQQRRQGANPVAQFTTIVSGRIARPSDPVIARKRPSAATS